MNFSVLLSFWELFAVYPTLVNWLLLLNYPKCFCTNWISLKHWETFSVSSNIFTFPDNNKLHKFIFCVKRAQMYSSLPFSLPRLRSEDCSWCLQETPFEYVEGGHSGSGTQGTLWSLQIWGPFFILRLRESEALPCQMFGNQAPSCVSSCCRLWWSHRFTRAAARPVVFQDTSGEKRKISCGNQITPPLQTHAHTLPAASIMLKHKGMTWRALDHFYKV